MRSRITVAGRTLSGLPARLIVARGTGLKINLMNDGQRPRTIAVGMDNIRVKDHLVHLGPRPLVRCVEHLFSALYGMNFFAVQIDLYHDELPFFDGSSRTFARALARLRSPRSAPSIRPALKVLVRRGGSFLEYNPEPSDRLVVDMTLRHAFIGTQRRVLRITPEIYCRDIAPARTFVFTDERDPRLKPIPPYGFALTRRAYYSACPPRFPDEAVRHKILDLLGDLYVLGGRLCGTIMGRNTSHALNHQLVRKIEKSIKTKK
jgi:UDP-3-O-[3-hydroxymyristoyl] N-acetylglucosamine deacetylase